MFLCLTFIVRVIVSPSLALFFVGSMYSLFWLPQIIRSVRCGRSSVLTVEYVIGTSICRLWFPLCEPIFLLCWFSLLGYRFLGQLLECIGRGAATYALRLESESGLTFSLGWVYILAVFVLFQVGVVLLQQWLGPAFFLPSRVCTHAVMRVTV